MDMAGWVNHSRYYDGQDEERQRAERHRAERRAIAEISLLDGLLPWRRPRRRTHDTNGSHTHRALANHRSATGNIGLSHLLRPSAVPPVVSPAAASIRRYAGQAGINPYTRSVVDPPAVIPAETNVSAAVDAPAEVKAPAAVAGPDSNAAAPLPIWTAEQDTLLLELKAENLSWQAIGLTMGIEEVLEGRYKELTKRKDEEVVKKEVVVKNETSNKKGKEVDKEAKVAIKEEKAADKNDEGADKKSKISDKKDKAANTDEETAEHLETSKQDTPKKGAMKKPNENEADKLQNKAKGAKGKVTFEEPTGKHKKEKAVWQKVRQNTTSTEENNMPKYATITMTEGAGLNTAEVAWMFNLYERLDDKMWLKIASAFFDSTGKRVDQKMLPTMFHRAGRS